MADHLQSGQRQSPEPLHLQRSSTLDNSCLIQTTSSSSSVAGGVGEGLAASVSALLQNGFGTASPNFSSPESLGSSGALNIIDQNESPSTASSSLPTLFFQQQQLISSSSAPNAPKLIHQQQQTPPQPPPPPPMVNWQNSRILAAIQHKQNQSSSHSLFSHDDDAFYRPPKLKPLNDPAIAECSGVSKSVSDIIVNGLVNGDIGGGHHSSAGHHNSKSFEGRYAGGEGEKSKTRQSFFFCFIFVLSQLKVLIKYYCFLFVSYFFRRYKSRRLFRRSGR